MELTRALAIRATNSPVAWVGYWRAPDPSLDGPGTLRGPMPTCSSAIDLLVFSSRGVATETVASEEELTVALDERFAPHPFASVFAVARPGSGSLCGYAYDDPAAIASSALPIAFVRRTGR